MSSLDRAFDSAAAQLDLPDGLLAKLKERLQREFGDDVWRIFREEERKGTFKVLGIISLAGVVKKFVERLAGPE